MTFVDVYHINTELESTFYPIRDYLLLSWKILRTTCQDQGFNVVKNLLATQEHLPKVNTVYRLIFVSRFFFHSKFPLRTYKTQFLTEETSFSFVKFGENYKKFRISIIFLAVTFVCINRNLFRKPNKNCSIKIEEKFTKSEKFFRKKISKDFVCAAIIQSWQTSATFFSPTVQKWFTKLNLLNNVHQKFYLETLSVFRSVRISFHPKT